MKQANPGNSLDLTMVYLDLYLVYLCHSYPSKIQGSLRRFCQVNDDTDYLTDPGVQVYNKRFVTLSIYLYQIQT